MNVPPQYVHLTNVGPIQKTMVIRREAAASPIDETEGYGYVLFKMSDTRTRPTRFATSRKLLEGVKLGTQVPVQSNEGVMLGLYMVVGVIDYKSGETTGDVPSRRLAKGEVTAWLP